jgi:hypothetical protein
MNSSPKTRPIVCWGTFSVGVCALSILVAASLTSHHFVVTGDYATDKVVSLNIWTYAQWSHEGLSTALIRGGIFAPADSSLLFSEPQPLLGLIGRCATKAGASVIGAYNIVQCSLVALSIITIGWVVIYVQRSGQIKTNQSNMTITLCVLWIAFNPIVAREAGVLQLWCLAPVLFCLLSWWRWRVLFLSANE